MGNLNFSWKRSCLISDRSFFDVINILGDRIFNDLRSGKVNQKPQNILDINPNSANEHKFKAKIMSKTRQDVNIWHAIS